MTVEPKVIPGSSEDSPEGTVPAGTSVSLLGVMLPQLSQQQAVEEGLGAWGLYLEALEKVPALLSLSATCHSWPVLIEINGLLSSSLGRLFREWILMGEGGTRATKPQAYSSGRRD